MRKVKRRPGRSPAPRKTEKPNIDAKPIATLVSEPLEVEQVFPPLIEKLSGQEELITAYRHQNPFSNSNQSHRCTYYRPSNEDFGQLTDAVLPPDDYYRNLLQEICGESSMPGTTKRKEMKNACQGSPLQTCSRSVEPASGEAVGENMMADLMADEGQWLTLDSVSAVDEFLDGTKKCEKRKEKVREQKFLPSIPNNVRIAETPRVKRIAEKYSKFKRNNIELRKLEERVVCLEYDIFDSNSDNPEVPIQKMRAFFSIKMKDNEENNNKENTTYIPSDVKRNFNIEDRDLQKLNRKEIEIIDEKIAENRSILEDLKRVLRRKQALESKKKQQTLDLMYLYEMAKRESPPVDNDYSKTNLLSTAELQEIKDLILKKCESNVYGINRKTMKCKQGGAVGDADCVISDSLISELMRDGITV